MGVDINRDLNLKPESSPGSEIECSRAVVSVCMNSEIETKRGRGRERREGERGERERERERERKRERARE